MRVDAEGVHPVPVHLLLPGLLDGVALHHLDHLLLGRVQRREVVEEVCHEGEVEPLLTLDHVPGRHEGAALDLVGLLQHGLGPVQQVSLAHRLLGHPRILGRNLVDQLRVDLTVLDIFMEVLDSPI